jgi:hypothetical protein
MLAWRLPVAAADAPESRPAALSAADSEAVPTRTRTRPRPVDRGRVRLVQTPTRLGGHLHAAMAVAAPSGTVWFKLSLRIPCASRGSLQGQNFEKGVALRLPRGSFTRSNFEKGVALGPLVVNLPES